VFVPGVPAVGGRMIDAAQTANKVVDAVNAADTAVDAAKVVDKASGAATTGAKATEGVYEVTTKTGSEYVGQSGNIPQRLNQHVQSGKVTPESAAAAKTTDVPGGKTSREVAEQTKINGKGGIGKLDNKRNPIGPKREHLMNNQKR
jgi:GIY-YIG catalytic domain